jgi:hypothetical protein
MAENQSTVREEGENEEKSTEKILAFLFIF